MDTIENEFLKIGVNSKGAELTSLQFKVDGTERLWRGDAAFWGKHSPVLFPVVGGLKQGKYRYKGTEYILGRHGFARDLPFNLVQKDEDKLVYELLFNEQTLSWYPFKFSFKLSYQLINNIVKVSYFVTNVDEEEMLFSVGAHPAFAVPFIAHSTFEDYSLVFNAEENAGIYPLNEEGLLQNDSVPFLRGNTLSLKKSLFYKDALVFKKLKSDTITIQHNDSSSSIKVHYPGFPFMGIWSAKDADFVCIEPWDGIADSVDASGELSEKEGILKLGAGETYSKWWTVELR